MSTSSTYMTLCVHDVDGVGPVADHKEIMGAGQQCNRVDWDTIRGAHCCGFERPNTLAALGVPQLHVMNEQSDFKISS